METRRLFAALELGSKVRDAVWDFSQSLRSIPSDASFVPKENLHVTVAFIGGVGAEKASSIARSFSNFSFPSFGFSVRTVGAFPNPDFIRVVWAGCHAENGEFSRLHQAVCNCVALNPKGSFAPHVTLARVKSRRNSDSIREFLLEHANDEFGRMRACAISLKASLLSPSGPKYETIASVRLSSD